MQQKPFDIFPAVDLRDGRVVRLKQGDYDRMTVYDESPVQAARRFAADGARHLHVVDLDGAKDGKTVNQETVGQIVADTDLFIEVGGGIRDESRISRYLSMGVSRVILGTAAVDSPEFLSEMVHKYGASIAVGVDARDGYVAVDGWRRITDTQSLSFCEKLQKMGVQTVIYTDISKDGMLSGTNLAVYKELSALKGLSVVASGGICTTSDLLSLRRMGASGAIVGKALYSGTITLKEIFSCLANESFPASM